MKLITTVIISALMLVTISCKKEKDCHTAIGINGEWIWVKSIGGLGGGTITPESENLKRKLIIDDFYYSEFINESLVLHTQYELEMTEEPIWGTTEKISFDSGGGYPIRIGDRELVLIGINPDGYSHYFKRN